MRFGTLEFYEAMAQSHYWIDNAHNFTWEAFPKKEGQILINLWHGSMGLKRINPEDDSSAQRRAAGKLASKTTDYCVTNSKFEEDVFKSTYWPNTEFLKFGHARNDVLFSSDEEFMKMRQKVCKKLGVVQGVDISFLNSEMQAIVYEAIVKTNVNMNKEQLH